MLDLTPSPDLTPIPTVIALIGPTAVGKTDHAVELAQRFPLDIISVDSAMVYRGMDIGTAKPDPSTLRIAPHRLIDICDPVAAYSAAMFRRDALREIADIHEKGRIPLLVGGTMLYFRALEQGLSRLPAADPAIRRRLEADAAEHGWQTLHARLERVDATAAGRIHPNDPQRIQRALEVHELTGRSMSELFGDKKAEPLPFVIVKIHVMPEDRAVLHGRIAQRFHHMLDKGFVGEVEALHRRGDLDPACPALRAVGYRQFWQYLVGEVGYEEAVERSITETRRLARRQMTWMRAETPDCTFDAFDDRTRGGILKYVASVTHYQM